MVLCVSRSGNGAIRKQKFQKIDFKNKNDNTKRELGTKILQSLSWLRLTSKVQIDLPESVSTYNKKFWTKT